MMRVLLCGVIGAVAAAAAWMALEHFTKQEFGWIAVGVGIITGIAVHWAAGSSARGSYARGALAAVLALAAIVSCRQVYAKVMQSFNERRTVAVAPVDQPGGDQEEGAASGEAAATLPVELPEQVERVGLRRAGGGNMVVQKGMSQWDMLWLCLAALSAYVVGKGRDGVVASTDQPSEEPSAPEQTQAEPSEQS